MRELWWMACGRIDADLSGRAFWMRILGQPVTADVIDAMHPLRRLEKPDTTEKDAGDGGWTVLGAGLKALNRDKGA